MLQPLCAVGFAISGRGGRGGVGLSESREAYYSYRHVRVLVQGIFCSHSRRAGQRQRGMAVYANSCTKVPVKMGKMPPKAGSKPRRANLAKISCQNDSTAHGSSG